MGIANTVIEVNGNINKALKEYKSSTERYKIKERLTEKKAFIKPSEKKRIQREETIRKNKLRNERSKREQKKGI